MNNVAAEMEHLHKLAKWTKGQGNPGKIEFGTPGARKRARPVWGGLGGNVRQQCRNAPPFHSITETVEGSASVIASAFVVLKPGSVCQSFRKLRPSNPALTSS